MRLRPSGRSGPLATQIDGFASYQENEAWTWEHMALTRARVVSAPPAFAARVEEVIRDVLCRPRRMPRLLPATSSRCAARSRRRRATAIAGTSNMPPAAWSTSSSSRNICNSCTPPNAGNPRHLDRARARQGVAAWAAGDRGRRSAAPGGAALSGPDADPAAVPAGPFDPKTARRGPARLAGARADMPDFTTLDAHSRPRPQSFRRRGLPAKASIRDYPTSQACLRNCGARALRPGTSCLRAAAALIGRRTTVVPTPSVERMRIVPPCSSVSDFAMARPSPEP